MVVWLTNRPIEEEKHQRKQFFKKLNQQVQQAFNVGLQSLNPFASKAAAQQQDDVNEASMLSQGLTGRTPQQHLGSQYTKDPTVISGLHNVTIKHIDEEQSQNEMTNRTQNVNFGN